MAGYFQSFGKKRQRLETEERAFADLLSSSPDSAALSEGVTRVRAAYLRALKERRATLAPSEKNAVAFANFAAEIERWKSLPDEKVRQYFADRQARAASRSAYRTPEDSGG